MFSLYPFCRFLSSFGKTLFSPLFPTPKNEKAKAPLWHGAFLSDFRLNAPLGLPLGLKEKQHADGNAQGIKPGRNAQDQPRRTDDHGGKQNHHDNQRHHREQHHPYKVRIGQLFIIDLHGTSPLAPRHDMDLVGADAHTNGLAGGAGAGGVDQPLTALALNVHLKVNALEDDIIDHAYQLTLHGADHFNVLGADHHLYALFPGKAAVHAGELHAREGDQEVAVHHAVHNVGVADEVRHKGILRLVVDILRGADLLHLAYEQTGYFVFSHEERLMPVSDNERMAIQHRLAKKKRAELIVRKLEEMEKMSKATDKKIQKRYQRMLMNLITSTADRYIYDCFCRFGAEFVREADYNENKLRTALNVSSEHTIKKSGQMRTYIQRAFPVGAEISVQEAKSMLRQVYKKMGLNTGRGITTKELEQYAEIENSRNREARMIKILKHK